MNYFNPDDDEADEGAEEEGGLWSYLSCSFYIQNHLLLKTLPPTAVFRPTSPSVPNAFIGCYG